MDEMVLFKACPRCQGDMHTNGDIYGDYKECLQCGLIMDIEKPSRNSALLAAAAKTKSRKKVAA